MRQAAFFASVAFVSLSCSEHESVALATPASEISLAAIERPIPTTCQGYTTPFGSAAPTRRFPNLSFRLPVQIVHHPSQPYWYVVEQEGTIVRFEDREDASSTEVVFQLTPFSGGWEDGLLGFTFHPDFDTNGEVIFKFTEPAPEEPSGYRDTVARVVSHDGGATFDPTSQETILSVSAAMSLHHGGPPGFGRDGYLYIPFGDGIAPPDEGPQNLSSLRGKILRLDVNSTPYAIPPDNPFVGVSGARPEIWAVGFRNPWGWAFDPESDHLWVGDTGNVSEEFERVRAGGNYGWPAREGGGCAPSASCTPDMEDAYFAYPNGGGAAVVGGPVYQGARFPEARGKPIVSDFVFGRIQYLDEKNGVVTAHSLVDASTNIVFLTVDGDGELLYATRTGGLYGLERKAMGRTVPRLLSQTGCVDLETPRTAPRGMLPYDVNMPLWSDGTEKTRWLALPEDRRLEVGDDGRLAPPIGTVLVKSFFVNDRPIETRLLVRHDDGDWGGYSYAWRDDRSDATLLDEGLFKVVDGMLWQYPSRQACTTCHTEGGGRTLGLSVEQLNRAFDFHGHLPENQLAAMTRMGVLSRALDAPEALPRFPEEGDTDAPAAGWARAYLQVNCAHCHVAGGAGVGGLDLSASARLPDLGCDRVPTYTLDIDGARVVAPGRPERSVLLARVANMDNWTRMPPIAAFRTNERAVERLRTWIEGLSSCEP